MGTRGIIAKPEGDGWAGRYHHWDSYPTGLGVTLLELHAGHFGGDVDAMIDYLVDGEPVGWSTINGADFGKPKGWHEADAICALCAAPMWRHYAQYYPKGRRSDPMVNGEHRKGLIHPDQVMQLGHSFEEMPAGPQGPQSYSARGETDDTWYRSTDDHDSGCEWVYVLTHGGVMVIEGDMGAFGMGGGNWRNPVVVPWGDVAAMSQVEADANACVDA